MSAAMFVSGSRLMLTALVLLGGVICSLTSVMMPISPTPPADGQNNSDASLHWQSMLGMLHNS
jgi:hypothetical protein